jgi:Ring finger domain
MEDTHSGAGSVRSFGSRRSFTGSKKVVTNGNDELDSDTPPADLEAQTDPIDSGVNKKRSDSVTDDEEDQGVLAFDFDDGHQKVYVPLQGQTTMDAEASEGATSCRRMVNSGCAICLCVFDPGEKITWSANRDCPHIFHSECILHWYLAVGRKAQRRRLRQHPDMSDEEIPSKICDFQTNCPCCRQNFCQDIRKLDVSSSSSRTAMESDSDDEVQQSGEVEADIETGPNSDGSMELESRNSS